MQLSKSILASGMAAVMLNGCAAATKEPVNGQSNSIVAPAEPELSREEKLAKSIQEAVSIKISPVSIIGVLDCDALKIDNRHFYDCSDFASDLIAEFYGRIETIAAEYGVSGCESSEIDYTGSAEILIHRCERIQE